MSKFIGEMALSFNARSDGAFSQQQIRVGQQSMKFYLRDLATNGQLGFNKTEGWLYMILLFLICYYIIV